MNRKLIYFLGSIIIILISILFIFVFKVKGSTNADLIGECVPYNVSIESGDNDYQVVVKWFTKKDCLGYVVYGDDRDSLDLISIDVEDLSSSKHTVKIDKLLTTKTYYLMINSDSVNYGNNGIPLSFSISSL